MNEPLSPAALAVIAAYNKETRPEPHHQCEAIAAALKAAVDQVVPSEYEIVDGYLQYKKQNSIREAFLAIAAELEANEL